MKGIIVIFEEANESYGCIGAIIAAVFGIFGFIGSLELFLYVFFKVSLIGMGESLTEDGGTMYTWIAYVVIAVLGLVAYFLKKPASTFTLIG